MTVTFVGAGPGDPALLTVAAVAALEAAEVVVYDRPSAEAVVALAPQAEHVCVGLAPGRRALAQDEVNELLVSLGGRAVVRLKSGDPFVASRGGEEARALQDAGVPVRVVPGVSSALGAPAAAGIPLMVRQRSVTCTIVDGNDDPEHGAPPDWEALARLGGTLVVLTGRGRIRRIAAALVAGGLPEGTPVAAISAGSRPQQRVLRGTLGALPAPLPPPVTFVIGEVAALDLTALPEVVHAHIPDGFLSGEAIAAGWAVAGAGMAVALRGVHREQRERDLPVAGLAAAFFLVGDAPLFPITVGTQGHLLGGMLAVALLGPWLGAVTIAVVCAIQALVLGDGGVTTLGLGIVNLALIPAFVGHPLLVALRRVLPRTPTGIAVAAGIGAWVCVVLASILFFLEFALGSVVDIDRATVGVSVIGVYAVIGVVEGIITALILRAVLAVRPDLVRVGQDLRRERAERGLEGVRA